MRTRTHSFVAVSTALPILTWAGFGAAIVVFLFQLIPLLDNALKKFRQNEAEPLHTLVAMGVFGGGFYLVDPLLSAYAMASYGLHIVIDMFENPRQIILPFSDREFGWVSDHAEKIIVTLAALGILIWMGWLASGF